MSVVSDESRDPPTMSGAATIASRTFVSAGASVRAPPVASSGAARIANARAMVASGNAYVGTPHASTAVTSADGLVSKIFETASRTATWLGCSGRQ